MTESYKDMLRKGRNMLQKIMFYTSRVCPAKEYDALRERLEKDGVKVVSRETEELEALPEAEEGTLFVTDDERILRRFQQAGRNIAVLFHENNRDRDFSGAAYGVTDMRHLARGVFERIYERFQGVPWTILKTERCIVREITVEDVDALYEIYKEPFITLYMQDLYENPAQEREYTRRYIDNVYGFYGYGIWIVETKEDGTIIGRAGIEQKEEDCPELGYMIGVPWQRKGYAYEVCQAVIDYAKRELEMRRVISQVRKENEASVRLLKKLGFYKKGETEEEEGLLDVYELCL